MPPASSRKTDILWLTRGVSFGHTTRDVAIIEALQSLRSDIQIHVVSYANGYVCLRQHGLDAEPMEVSYGWLDLMSESDLVNWFLSSIDQFGTLMRRHAPRLVVSDEEFLASIPASRLKIPSILISDKVPGELNGLLGEFVRIGWDFFSMVLIPDSYELFEAKDLVLDDKEVRYAGPIIRYPSGMPSREEIRHHIGIPQDAILVLVSNGANSRTRRIFELANEAAALSEDKLMSWTQVGPYAPENAMSPAIKTCPSLGWEFLHHLHACDVVVTGAGLSTLNEILWLQVPCIAFPIPRHRFQQRDAKRVKAGQGVVLDMDDCAGAHLLQIIQELTSASSKRLLPDSNLVKQPAYNAAQCIVEMLDGVKT